MTDFNQSIKRFFVVIMRYIKQFATTPKAQWEKHKHYQLTVRISKYSTFKIYCLKKLNSEITYFP